MVDWDIGRLTDCQVQLRKSSMGGGAVGVVESKSLKTAMADLIGISQMPHKAMEQPTHNNQVAERRASRAKEDKDGKKDGLFTPSFSKSDIMNSASLFQSVLPQSSSWFKTVEFETVSCSIVVFLLPCVFYRGGGHRGGAVRLGVRGEAGSGA